MKNISVILILIIAASCTSRKNKPANALTPISLMEMEEGKALYTAKCMNCHKNNGEGQDPNYPPLAKSDFLKHSLEESIRIVKYGGSQEIIVNGKKYKNYMPASGLKPEDTKLIINYILNAWGNNYGVVDTETIEAIKEKR